MLTASARWPRRPRPLPTCRLPAPARPHAGGRRPTPSSARRSCSRCCATPASSTPARPGWSSSPGARSPASRGERITAPASISAARPLARRGAARRALALPLLHHVPGRGRRDRRRRPGGATWIRSATRCWWWGSRRRSRCTSTRTIRRPRSSLAPGDGRRRPGRDRRHAHGRRPSGSGGCAWSPTRPATAVVAIVAGEGNEPRTARPAPSRIVAGGQSMNPSAGEIAQAIARGGRATASWCCRTTAT